MIFVSIAVSIYVIGSSIYIVSQISTNHQLQESIQCLDICMSHGMILQKDNNWWNHRYTVIRPIGGLIEYRCPTTQPTLYFTFNRTLVGYMESVDMLSNHNVNIIGCNGLIQYTMRVGESFPILINQNLFMVSAVIRQNDRAIFYVKHGVYGTYDIDLYNDQNVVVANLLYTDQWSIDADDKVDHLLFLSLVGYHQIYINGFEPDRCNDYVMITIMLIFSILILLCCVCCVQMTTMYNNLYSKPSYNLNNSSLNNSSLNNSSGYQSPDDQKYGSDHQYYE